MQRVHALPGRPCGRSIAYLIEQLGGRDWPEPVLDAVVWYAVNDPDPGVCWNAARELAKLGPRASAALPALAEALKSHDATTALSAHE